MRYISRIDHHPEVRKERFPPHLWPIGNTPKELDEGWFALEFLTAAGLHPDSAPRKLAPPFPDLECVVGGQRLLFELGEIIETDLAEGFAFSNKQAGEKANAIALGEIERVNSIQTAGFRSYPANSALDKILRRKLRKGYTTGDLPAHLLLFYDSQRVWGPFDYLLSLKNELAGLLEASVFQTVWIFCLPEMAVIGRLDVRNGELAAPFDWRFHFDSSAPFEALVPSADGRHDEVGNFVPVLIPRE